MSRLLVALLLGATVFQPVAFVFAADPEIAPVESKEEPPVAPEDKPETPPAALPPDATARSGSEEQIIDPFDRNRSQTPHGEGKTDPKTGAYSYYYPITIPAPHTAGLLPLALTYSSQETSNENSAGYGWSLSIPSIERVNKTGLEDVYYQSYFSQSEVGELIASATSTNYYPATTGQPAHRFAQTCTDDACWIESPSDGTYRVYGFSSSARLADPADATHIFESHLEKIYDAHGNSVTISYTQDENQSYPTQIIYDGHTSESPGTYLADSSITDAETGAIVVDLAYEDRPDDFTSYARGFGVSTTQRLQSVTVSVDGVLVHTYTLSYSTGANGSRSLLSTIEQNATFTTSFNYSAATKTWTESTAHQIPTDTDGATAGKFSGSAQDDYGIRLGDVNGDAFPDWVQASESESGGVVTRAVKTVLNGADGTGWPDVSDTDLALPLGFFQTVGGNDVYQGTYLLDVDGDAKSDLLRSADADDQLYLGDGATWTSSSALSLGTGFFNTAWQNTGIRLMNLNGDRLSDKYQCDDSEHLYWGSGSSYRITCTNAAINEPGTGWVEDETLYPSEGWTFPNFDVTITGSAGSVANETADISGLQLLDVNADGLDDAIFLRNTSDSNRAVYLNQWSNWGSADTTWSGYPSFQQTELGYYASQRFNFVDVNADGFVDIIDLNPLPDFSVYINNGDGTGWTTDASYSADLYDATPYTTIDTRNQDGYRFVDVNADGLMDIVMALGVVSSIDANNVYLQDGDVPDMLTGVVTAQGAEVTVDYAPSSGFDNPDLPIVVQVVSSITLDDGFGNTAATSYDYANGVMYDDSFEDFRFAGFHTVTTTNPDGTSVKQYFYQGNDTDSALGEVSDSKAKIGYQYRQEVMDAAGSVVQATITRLGEETLSSGAAFVYISSNLVRTATVSGWSDVAESSTYDSATGNVLTQTRSGEVSGADDGTFIDTGSDVVTTTATYAASGSGCADVWGIPCNLPATSVVSDSAGTTVAEERFTYDDLVEGYVTVGDMTTRRQWISGSTYAESAYTYNAYGNVLTTTAPNGAVTTIAYDAQNRYPSTVTNDLSQTTTYVYDASIGQPTSVTNPNGGQEAMTYDEYARPLTHSRSAETTPTTLNTVETWTYNDTSSPRFVTHRSYWSSSSYAEEITYLDGFDRLIEVKTLNEDATSYNETETAYDDMGRVASSTLPVASASSAYDANTVSSNLAETYAYDDMGRVTSVTNILGTTTTSYDGLTKTVLDPLGNQKDYVTDGLGRLTSVVEYIDGVGYTTSYEWSASDNLTKITDSMGNVRNLTYDGRGLRLTAEDLHATTDTYYGTWTYTYDDAGNMTTSLSPNGVTVTYAYDDLNRVTSETPSSGSATTYTYDSCTNGTGQLCATSVDGGASQAFTYFASGRTSSETSTIASTSYTTNWTYDYQGNPLTTTHPDSSVVTNTYNALGRIETIEGVVLDVDYGPHGQVTSETYANGTASTYTYDAAARYRLTRKQTTGLTASSSSTVTFYPAAGDGAVNRTGPSWDAVHDAVNGTTAGSTPTTATVRTGKNATGNYLIERAFLPFDTSSLTDEATITSATLKIYVSAKTNDDNDGDDFVTIVQGSQPDTSTLTTADYDLAGSVNTPTEGIDTSERKDISSVTTGAYLTFNLNSVGQSFVSLTGATKLALREGHDVVDSAFTGSANQYNSLQFRTGEFAGTASDPVLEVTYSIPGEPITLQDLNYSYDAAGNITQIIDASSTDSAKTTDYTYDDLYRLTSATITGAASGSNETISYTYNILGNITYRSDFGTYTYAGSTSTAPATRYANPHAVTSILKTDGTTKNFSYDTNGNVKSDGTLTLTWDYKNRLASSKKGMTTTTFAYDAADARVSKTTGTTTTYYPSGEYSVKGSTTTIHIGSYATVDTTSGVSTTRTNHADHLGSTSIVTDSTGVMAELLDYYPYGGERLHTGTADEQKTYIGEYSDDESGLSYLNARYYDPSRGMFLSQDSMFLTVGAFNDERQLGMLIDPQLQNSYSYARNNPISMSDGSGESPLDTIAGFFAGTVKGAWGIVKDLWQITTHPVATFNSMMAGIRALAADPLGTAQFLARYLGGEVESYMALTDYRQGEMLGVLAIGMIGTGKKGFVDDLARAAMKAATKGVIERGIYRGGTSFTLREGEKAISLNIDPLNKYVTQYGGANRIVSLPEGLEIIKDGPSGHYLIVPSDPNMKREDFQGLLNQIETSAHE